MYTFENLIEEVQRNLLILKNDTLQEKTVQFVKNATIIENFVLKAFLGDFVNNTDIYEKPDFSKILPEYRKIFQEYHNLLTIQTAQINRYGQDILIENATEISPARRLPVKMLANVIQLQEQAIQLILKN